jgi:Kef-type K+ transport system membrane component KefB/voltage-gated potassium channel Kch
MENIFSGLSLIIAIGAGVSLFMRYIRQPLMIGYILTGILVGPAILHVLDSPRSLTVFGDLGIALLLFIIGLGMNPRVVKEVGRPSVIITLSQMGVTGIVGWLIMVALGLNHTEALFISFGLTINSTIVALKLLSDKKETGRLYGKLTIGASLVEDIIAAIALLLVASVHNGEWLAMGSLVSLIFKGAVIGSGMYVVTRYLLPKAQRLIASDQELLFLCAIAWGLGSAALLAKAGFSLEIGALAAGVFLASLPYAQEIASRLRPLRDFFVIVFFIALGTQLTFSQFGQLFWPVVIGTLLVVGLKPFIIMASLGFLGYTKRTSFKTAITLSQVSEFSIIFVVLGSQKGLIGQNIVVMLTFIALTSIAISTYMVTFSDQLYAKLERYLTLFERRKDLGEIKPEERNELVLFGYQRGGHEFINLFKKLKKKYVVIDYDPEIIDTIERRKINYLYGDATDAELLEEAGVQHAKLIVSTIPDYDVNIFLLNYLKHNNPASVAIVHTDDPLEAARLYEAGASYVILPHYIGSEKVSEFISKSGLAKSAFRKQRVKHLDYLEKHYGALEKLSQIQEKRLGRTIVKGVASITKARH